MLKNRTIVHWWECFPLSWIVVLLCSLRLGISQKPVVWGLLGECSWIKQVAPANLTFGAFESVWGVILEVSIGGRKEGPLSEIQLQNLKSCIFRGHDSLRQLETNNDESIPSIFPVISKTRNCRPRALRRELRCMAQRGGSQLATGGALEASAQRGGSTGGRSGSCSSGVGEVGEEKTRGSEWCGDLRCWIDMDWYMISGDETYENHLWP